MTVILACSPSSRAGISSLRHYHQGKFCVIPRLSLGRRDGVRRGIEPLSSDHNRRCSPELPQRCQRRIRTFNHRLNRTLHCRCAIWQRWERSTGCLVSFSRTRSRHLSIPIYPEIQVAPKLGTRDSNPHDKDQNLACCRYTNPERRRSDGGAMLITQYLAPS